ncbi:MAG: hypothetical protein HW378_3640 [Anaerolineales bacterium]|nr:hypothetical protein [Anaerolineales bacterium]
MSRDPAYLLDILQAARRIREGLGGVAKDAFLKDWMRHSAVVRQIEIIGEATKRLSEEFRNSHPEIPWRSMTGMRDVVIHGYDHVDLDEVWRVAEADIPRLIAMLEPLVPPEETSEQ